MAAKKTPKGAGSVVRSLPPQELKKLLHLVRNAKSIEIKVSVPMAAHQRTALGMGIDPVEAEVRHVYSFDTANQEARSGLYDWGGLLVVMVGDKEQVLPQLEKAGFARPRLVDVEGRAVSN